MKVGGLLLREFESIAMLSDDENDNNDDETRLSQEHDMSCSIVIL